MTDGKHREPEPTQGTDEEGETPLREDSDTDDRASWVHGTRDKPEDGAGDHPDARDRRDGNPDGPGRFA